jgi:hypothetical protein
MTNDAQGDEDGNLDDEELEDEESCDPDEWLGGKCLLTVDWDSGMAGGGELLHFHRFPDGEVTTASWGEESARTFKDLAEALDHFFPGCAIVEGDRVAERSEEIDAIAPECSYAFICGVLYTRWDRSWVSPDGEYELTRTPKGWTDEPWLED